MARTGRRRSGANSEFVKRASAIDGAGCRSAQHTFGDGFRLRSSGIEVIRGHKTRRCAQPEGLDKGVEPQVVKMGSREAASLEINDDLARCVAFGATKSKIGATRKDDSTAEKFGP